MSKSSLGGQYNLTASYTTLSTLLGVGDETLGKIGLSVSPSHANVVYLQLSDQDHPVQIAVGVGFEHEFAAVQLSTISVKGTPGDTITLVGEGIERIEQGSMY
jgi:hypothetical protein